MQIAVAHGPNLGRLGKRLPSMYGFESLGEIENKLREDFPVVDFLFFQSNHEGALVDFLESCKPDGCVINAGALAHQSYVLADALEAMECPIVEVHISAVFKRESFRHRSLIAPYVSGQIYGLGTLGYNLACQWIISKINP